MHGILDTHQRDRWTINTWDRALGRGTITCPQLGEMSFDAASAMVDDFRIGEIVHIELEPGGARVRRIWPDDPRFTPREAVRHPSPPQLLAEVALLASDVLARIPVTLDYRVAKLDRDLVVEGDDDLFAYGHAVEIRFRSVEYIELPTAWEGAAFALARDEERTYLATRGEVNSRTIAVRIVDGGQRVFFVTCAAIAFTSKTVPSAPTS